MPRGKPGSHDECWCGRKAHAGGECMAHYQATRRAEVRARECSWTEGDKRVCTTDRLPSKNFCFRHEQMWRAMIDTMKDSAA